jgi:hypothetical protein
MLISLALVLAAQDLPPGVLLLSRIKRHLRDELTHLPDYTCLETAQRQVRSAGAKSDLKPMDTVRLEVLYTGTHELYAAPGDLDFRENRPSAFTAGGLSASGLFGMFLHAIFINDLGTFTWRGEETLGGRPAVRYDYRVPVMVAGWNIHSAAVSGQVGMKGSFWADPDSLDLLRLKVQADDIPPTLDVADATILIEYSRTRIGDADVLLPQSGELRLRHTTGAEGRNLMDYTHCRSFQAQSSLNFGEPVESSAAATSTAAASTAAASSAPIGLPPSAAPPPRGVQTLPPGIAFAVKLTAPIGDTDNIGTSIAGRVAADVVLKRKVLVPEGALVTGRIRRLERSEQSGGYCTVGIEFMEVHSGDSSYRFYAELQDLDARPDIGWLLLDNGAIAVTRDRRSLPNLPGVATFFVLGSHFSLPEGFRTMWKTLHFPIER